MALIAPLKLVLDFDYAGIAAGIEGGFGGFGTSYDDETFTLGPFNPSQNEQISAYLLDSGAVDRPYGDIQVYINIAGGGGFRIPALDHCPFPSTQVVEAYGYIRSIGNTMTTGTATYYWSDTPDGDNNVFSVNKNQYHCVDLSTTVDTDPLISFGLLGIKPHDTTSLYPVIIASTGTGRNMGTDFKKVDLTDFVKAYLDNKNNYKFFDAWIVPGNGTSITPGFDTIENVCKAVFENYTTMDLVYEYVGDVGIPYYGIGSTSDSQLTLGSINMSNIYVKFTGDFELNANSRVQYRMFQSE